jgi:DNA repair exonuclease SbcCD ATPase subunit
VSYVLQHIFFCLLIAAVIGGIIGWLLRHFGLSGRLRELQEEWSGKVGAIAGERDQFALRLKESDGALAGLKNTLAGLEADRARLTTDLETVSGRIPVLETAVADWAARGRSWETDRAKFAADLKTCVDARSILTAQVADWSEKAKAWAKDQAALQAKVTDLTRQAADLTGKVQSLDGERSRLTADLQKTEANWKAKHESLEASLRSRISQLETQARAAAAGDASEDANFRRTIDDLRAQLVKAQQVVGEWQSKHDSLEANLRNQIAQLESRARAAAGEEAAWRTRLGALESERDGMKVRLTQVEAEWGSRYRELERKLTAIPPLAMAAAAAPSPASDVRTQQPKSPPGDIERIEGIGPVYGQKLRSIGIAWVKELLEQGSAPAGRERIASQTQIDRRLILKWVNAADLLRIEGVNPDHAELLEEAGVDTIRELRNRVPENLYEKLVETNRRRSFARDVPSVVIIRGWIEKAKKLEPLVTH